MPTCQRWEHSDDSFYELGRATRASGFYSPEGLRLLDLRRGIRALF